MLSRIFYVLVDFIEEQLIKAFSLVLAILIIFLLLSNAEGIWNFFMK